MVKMGRVGGRRADESFSAMFGPRDWGTSGFGGE